MFGNLRAYFIGDLLQNSKSLHDKSRIGLFYNITFSLLVLGIISTIVALILDTKPILIPTVGNIVFSLITLFTIRIVNFTSAAIVYFSALALLLFGNLIFNEGTMHIGGPFWIMLLNILVYYILGRVWGIGTLIMSAIGFSYYIIYVYPISIEIANKLPATVYYSAIYETAFALFLLAYIVATILNASRNSDRLLTQQNLELLEQNETISLNSSEKTVLLKEVHHRVKNNLQVIISLMRLQMRDLKGDEAIMKFKETINRVLTMSMIHEKMYQSESLSKVNLEQYFRDLSTDLLSSFETEYKVKFIYKFDIDKVELKSIVPLALIFNELYSNSLKHAFLNISNPSIELSMFKDEDRNLILEYSDNGQWKKPSTEASFGMELIDSLTSQLDGKMQFKQEPKTQFKFTFSALDYVP